MAVLILLLIRNTRIHQLKASMQEGVEALKK
jgi:hypothetical protein